MINRAIRFATTAHEGQVRKGSQLPYILHPLEVGAILASMTDKHEVIAAGILHDVLEDTNVDYGTLEHEFGSRIAQWVAAESEDKQEDLPAVETWKARKQATLDALAMESDIHVKMIALADKLSNIRAMHADYTRLGSKLWERFNQKDPAEHAWYYASIASLCSDLSEHCAWKEYHALVKKVFQPYL